MKLIAPETLSRLREDTFASLYVRNYRLYFIGQIISTTGTFMQMVAQAWLVLRLTRSGTALGLVAALQYLPILLIGPYGGVVADRFSKRRILLSTQSISGALALGLGTLVATGAVRLWMVFVLAGALGLINAFDNPTRQTFHIELVGPERVRNAVTLYSILVNVARIAGPAAAGLIIALAGLAPCFLVNGASFAAVVIMLLRMDPGQLRRCPPVPAARGQIREGFRYVRETPVVGSCLLMMAIVGTLSFEFQVSLPLLAHFTFHGEAGSYAFLSSAMGLGAAAGGLFLAGRRERRSSLALAAAVFGAAILAAAFMPTLILAGVAMVAVGMASIHFSSLGNSILQLAAAPRMRGRVMALWSVAFLGSTTLGGPIVGWCAEWLGARWGLALGGFAALAAATLGTRGRAGKITNE